MVLYNVVAMTNILNDLHAEGFQFTEDDLTFLSPYIHEHINRFGKYQVNLGERPRVMDLDALHGGFLSHHRPPEIGVEH